MQQGYPNFFNRKITYEPFVALLSFQAAFAFQA